MNHNPLNPDNWHQGLDVTALCAGGEDPTTARQYAVQKPGERPSVNGDQVWVRDGRALQHAGPGARIVARTITIKYGEWEDATPIPDGEQAVIRCLISGLDGEQIATSHWKYEETHTSRNFRTPQKVPVEQRWLVGGYEREWSREQIHQVLAVLDLGRRP